VEVFELCFKKTEPLCFAGTDEKTKPLCFAGTDEKAEPLHPKIKSRCKDDN
jgi:hypothetical protein